MQQNSIRHACVILFITVFTFIHSAEHTVDPKEERMCECKFLNAARDYGYGDLFKKELDSIPGVNVNAVDANGRNALHLGLTRLESREESFFDLLFSLKISTTHQDSISGYTPLHTFLENLNTLYSYGNGYYAGKFVRTGLMQSIAKKLLAITPKTVFLTPNYLGKIPFDYLNNEHVNLFYPELKKLLAPTVLLPFNPAVPRLLSAPFAGQAEVDELIKITTDRKIFGAILHELKVSYKRNFDRLNTDTCKYLGKKLVAFLSMWDCINKWLVSRRFLQTEIAHRIAWYKQFDPDLTVQEKKSLAILDIEIKK